MKIFLNFIMINFAQGGKVKIIIFIVVVLFFSNLDLYSQKDEVNKLIKLSTEGKLDEVRNAIPDLLAKYPDDPGVKFLHASVIEDALLAIEVYKRIIKEFPNNEFADDSYWRIIQFYAIMGDVTKADEELLQFRKKHSTSPFLSPAVDIVRSATAYANFSKRSTVNPIKAREQDNREKEILGMSNDNHTSKPETVAKEPIVNTENAKPTDNEVHYGMQVGIYKDKNTAESEKARFLKLRLRTEIIEKKVQGKVMFAVVIGHYSSQQSAESARNVVAKQCQCEPLIYKK